ncbi:H-NS histone family protein [uncultured Sulfitobacter sp.]|uniref:H-NS histone family protein n=1 Tax=uncultured Sulfitobacter sp. TaxID=191468 RepID=UPI002595FE0E|nr:H-NS histone family protein [uncultured Sulfitobacter sp.]
MNLSEMTYPELAEHQKEVDAAMRNLEKSRKADAKKAVKATAKEHGFTIEDLFDLPTKAKSSAPKAPTKYRNPDNDAETWTGRGRKPQWIKDALEKDSDLSRFEI